MRTILTSIQDYLSSSFQKKDFQKYNFEHVSIKLAPIKKDGQENEEDITITLLRIEEETSRKPQSVYHYVKEDDKLIKKANPDVCLNLYILIVSHAHDYETALLEISKVIYWMNSFQSKDCIVELQTLTAEQNNSLWQTLGIEIKPAVVYKVRMVTISAETLEKPVDAVSTVLLSRDSGPWSAVSAKLHAGTGLTGEEKKLLCQMMVERYAEPIEPLEEKPGEEYPEFWKRRKGLLDYWTKETWHDTEIESLKKTDEETCNQRLYTIRRVQQEALLEGLRAIKAKPAEERTDVEKEALGRALEDEELKNKI